MTLALRLLNQTVTVVDQVQTGTDDYGDPVYGDPVEHDVAGCSVQPQGTSEALSDQDHVVSTWRLWGPREMALSATSQVRVDGVLFDVSGEPQRYSTPTGLNHTVVELTRWQG